MKTTAVAMITALLSFCIGNIWVFVSADMFVRYFYEARMVALTHVFTLGWISLMIVGVLRQLAPIAFGLNLPQPGLLGFAVALWIPGLLAMVAGFATLQYRLAAVGTSVLFVAIVVEAAVLLSGFRKIRWEAPHTHLFAALLYFVSAAVLGVCGLIGMAAGLLSGGEWYPVFGSFLAGACIWYAVAFIPVPRINSELAQKRNRQTCACVRHFPPRNLRPPEPCIPRPPSP